MRFTKFLMACSILLGAAGGGSAFGQNSLLWEISGGGLSKPSYLFGTIHLICPDDFTLSDSLKKAAAEVSQITLEIDMDDPGMMATMMKSVYLPEGKDIKGMMTPANYEKLSRFYTDSLKFGLEASGRFKPFTLLAVLFNSVLACQPKSYELALVEPAATQKKEITGVETIEEQMAVFDAIPYTDQLNLIVTMIDSMPTVRKEFRDLVGLYKSEHIQELYNLTISSEYGLDGNEELMLFERNRKWIPRMRKIMAEKPTLFAVGAAHLGGPKGVIALLQKEGYRLRPVKTH